VVTGGGRRGSAGHVGPFQGTVGVRPSAARAGAAR
jgi:hypothetical protein